MIRPDSRLQPQQNPPWLQMVAQSKRRSARVAIGQVAREWPCTPSGMMIVRAENVPHYIQSSTRTIADFWLASEHTTRETMGVLRAAQLRGSRCSNAVLILF
ncbi:hypothetical protein XPA_004454 [Xanthoria parietina]